MYPTASTLFCLGERGGLCFGQGRGLSTTSVVPNLNASLTDRPTDRPVGVHAAEVRELPNRGRPARAHVDPQCLPKNEAQQRGAVTEDQSSPLEEVHGVGHRLSH